MFLSVIALVSAAVEPGQDRGKWIERSLVRSPRRHGLVRRRTRSYNRRRSRNYLASPAASGSESSTARRERPIHLPSGLRCRSFEGRGGNARRGIDIPWRDVATRRRLPLRHGLASGSVEPTARREAHPTNQGLAVSARGKCATQYSSPSRDTRKWRFP